jgi:serine/threonine protein kinase
VDKESDQFNLSSKARMPFETCAPELLRDQALQDSRVDVWAFGCVAYGLAAGEYPFGPIGNVFQLHPYFENIAQLARLSRESMPLVERTRVDTSDLINRILVHSLQIEPRNRFESHELLDLIHGQYELVPKRDASATDNIRILIRSLSRKRVNLEIERSASIAHVKLLFEDKELVPADRIQLLFDVKRLEDENTLEYYGIDDGSILDAVLAARWRTYEQEITLPLNVEKEVDRLLNAYNRRGDRDDTSFREGFEAATVKILEQVGFYTWDTYQRSKISRLTRLHAEMYKAPERDV